MSKPKRFTPAFVWEGYLQVASTKQSTKGEYVLYSDYANLKAEVARLRKAGDALVKDNLNWYTNHNNIKAWQAAKEGKQP